MKCKTLAAVALSNRDYTSLDAKIDQAIHWTRFAAGQGAELVVLPETLAQYYGDGVDAVKPQPFEDKVVTDWRGTFDRLLDAAVTAGVATVLCNFEPVEGGFANAFYVVDKAGNTCGRYQKMYPTPAELDSGVVPGGVQPLIEWDGLKLAGAICFDSTMPEGIEQQARRGADLLVMPSYWPGGTVLDHLARRYTMPVALAYPAWSRVIDAFGTPVAETGNRFETQRFGFGAPVALGTVNLDAVSLFGDTNQQKIVDIQSHYGDKVRVRFDQRDCLFLLESCCSDTTVDEIVQQFGLVPYQQYFADCMARCEAVLASTPGRSGPGSSSKPGPHRQPAEQVRRLVADGRHNAFTGLRRFGDRLVLTYRTSSGHGIPDGDIAVKVSRDDGQTWQDAASPFTRDRAYYEGHMTVLGDRLLMYSGSFDRGDVLDKTTQQEFVAYSDDAETWSRPQPACEPGWRYWHPVEHDGQLYVARYRVDFTKLGPDDRIPPQYWQVELMRSDDGLTWSPVSMIADGIAANETELCFDADGTLHAWLRCEQVPGHMVERCSEPPYTQWSEPRDIGQVIQGQCVADVGGRRFMVGRFRACNDRLGTRYEDRSSIRTKVWVYEPDRGFWLDYVELPSGGDTSYAGIVPLDGHRMLVSYYSQHAYANHDGGFDINAPADIYLATVRTDAPAQWGTLGANIV